MKPLWTQLEEYTDRSEEEKELLAEIRMHLVRIRSIVKPGHIISDSDRGVIEDILDELIPK